MTHSVKITRKSSAGFLKLVKYSDNLKPAPKKCQTVKNHNQESKTLRFLSYDTLSFGFCENTKS